MPRRPHLKRYFKIVSHRPKKHKNAHKPTKDDLINAESKFGRTLFGPIPEGHQREFFHDQQNIWIWHEAWREGGRSHSVTTRYEVCPTGVFKRAGRTGYVRLDGDELKNFRRATHAYLKIVKEKLYN